MLLMDIMAHLGTTKKNPCQVWPFTALTYVNFSISEFALLSRVFYFLRPSSLCSISAVFLVRMSMFRMSGKVPRVVLGCLDSRV